MSSSLNYVRGMADTSSLNMLWVAESGIISLFGLAEKVRREGSLQGRWRLGFQLHQRPFMSCLIV